MTFLESVGLVKSQVVPPEPHLKSDEVKPNGKKWGTPEYKYGLVYIYCSPEDKELCKQIAKRTNLRMKDVIHRALIQANTPVDTGSFPELMKDIDKIFAPFDMRPRV